MKIESHDQLKQVFIDKLQEKFGDIREGIHVSDLVYCLREAYFRKTNPVAFTEKQLGYFVDGARRHGELQNLLGVQKEVEVERFGVQGTIDVLLDKPCEIKTTRARSSLPDHYFTQLGFYCVLNGTCSGYLVVQRLLNENPWEFYIVEWTPEEITSLEEEMKGKATLLREALALQDFHILPKADSKLSWKCHGCSYSDQCMQ